MITDLDIQFETIIDDDFYINRYNTNKHKFESGLVIKTTGPF